MVGNRRRQLGCAVVGTGFAIAAVEAVAGVAFGYSGRWLLGIFVVAAAMLVCGPIALRRTHHDENERLAAIATILGSLGPAFGPLADRAPANVEAAGLVAVCLSSLVVATIAFVHRSRHDQIGFNTTQALLEWLQVWLCVCVAVWSVASTHAFVMPVAAWLVVLTGASMTAMFSMTTIFGVRETDLTLRAMSIATTVILAAALYGFLARVTGGVIWPASAVSALAWSVAIFTFAWRDAAVAYSEPQFTERTRVLIVGTVMALGLIGGLVGLLTRAGVPALIWFVMLVIVASLWAREQVEAVRTAHMLHRLSAEALRDSLTGLPNRRALTKWLEGKQLSVDLTVVTLDLSKFKDVNDLLGHPVGDRLLVELSERLRVESSGVGGQVYRMAGDEFTIVSSGDLAAGTRLAHSIADIVNRAAIAVPGVERLGVGVAVGVRQVPGTVRPEQRVDAVVQSSRALHEAKTEGRRRVSFFSDVLDAGYQRRKAIELRLRENLSDVTLTYQPIMEPREQRVVGFEALARWTDPELGFVSPVEFIEVAEASGLIHELGRHILSTALRDLIGAGVLVGRHVNVNVSALQLRRPGFAEFVLTTLDEYGLSGEELVLEVTESIPIHADGPAARAMRVLSSAGVKLAIDDFGAGATSVSYLSKLPVSIVKLDRALTLAMHEDGTASVIRGLLEMCRGLKLESVLEGVEDAEQRDRAICFGVNYLQGWHYAKAVPVVELSALVGSLEAVGPAELTVQIPAQRRA